MTAVDVSQYDPLVESIQANPYPYYVGLRREAPVFYVESLNGYAVSRHADVRRVLHDHSTFSSAAMATLVNRPVAYASSPEEENPSATSIIGTDGDHHARLRTIVNRGFTPRRMGQMEDDLRVLARLYAMSLVTRGTGDLQSGLAIPFPTTVIAELLGVDGARREDFRRWSEQMVFAVFEPATPEQQAEVARASAQMTEWLLETIAERQNGMGDDLISVLLRAEAEGGALTHAELEVFVVTLLVAGSITTAYLIGSTVLALVRDPALQAQARANPEFVGKIVEEILRHDAPTQMMFRTTTAEVEIAGSTIPSGATVLALIGSANRDENVFEHPDRFDPTRTTTDQLSFGHGVHYCLGAALARLEARLAVQELLACAPKLELGGAVEPVSSLVFRGPWHAPLVYQ